MGLFYTTFTTYDLDQAKFMAVLQKLRRNAYVSPTTNLYTVLYEQETEEQDFKKIESLGKKLSKECKSNFLASALHDDDVLYLWLFQNGKCSDFYNSLPQYFDPVAEPGPPEGGDANLLCNAFGREKHIKRVDKILRANLLENELPKISGELERHQALIAELGMPAFAAEVTFSSIKGKYFSKSFANIQFTSTNSD